MSKLISDSVTRGIKSRSHNGIIRLPVQRENQLFTLHPGGASGARANPQPPLSPLLALGTLPPTSPLLQQAHLASRMPWCPLWTGQGCRTCDWALEACPGPPSPTHCQGGLCPRWERGVQEGIFGPLLLPEGRDELQAQPGFSISQQQDSW